MLLHLAGLLVVKSGIPVGVIRPDELVDRNSISILVVAAAFLLTLQHTWQRRDPSWWLVGLIMLAFALSFDEIIVTIFTAGKERTLPIWFFNELFRPRDRPVTNVVAVIVIAVTIIPIVLAYYLTRPDDEHENAR